MSGDRVIEIGCVEMVDKLLTGEHYHVYINPERDVPAGAVKVHGLTDAFLADKPVMADVIDGFIKFVGDDGILVAHNADFDMRFINWELENLGKPIIPQHRFLDTLAIARGKFPGSPNSLDALCKRFGIENAHRSLHGALLDSEILADVYIELTGGRQGGLDLSVKKGARLASAAKKPRAYRSFSVPEEEAEAHEVFVKKLKDPVWHQ